MKFYPYYNANSNDEIFKFIQSQKYCELITWSQSSRPKVGIFNPIFISDKIYIHLLSSDEQIPDLDSEKALVIFHEFLCTIPSYWVEEKYAGAATSYYLYVELDCSVKKIINPMEISKLLTQMMQQYQPEGKFEFINPESKTYKASIHSLVILELKIESIRSKFKVGQNRSVETRNKILDHLRTRNSLNDKKAIEEVLKHMKSTDNTG